MNNDLFPDFTNIIQIIWLVFSRGGWIVFILLLIYIAYKVYVNEIQNQYLSSIQYTMLELKPPRENPTSFYHMEQVFLQLHQLFDNWTFQEKYIEGKLVFRISLEIVSLGGKISYLARIPTKHRNLFEAAFYANFPTLEISEVGDYLENFNFDPENPSYDLFGAEFLLTKPESFPIRTYRSFEGLKGPEASDILVDPLGPLLEVFTKITDQEFYGLQYILEPVMDDSWHDEADKEIEKIKNERPMLELDEVEKGDITAVKEKLSKPGFKTKIRILHIGSIEKFNADHKKLVLSPFRVFANPTSNSFRPGYGPKKDYRFSKSLEGEYIAWWTKRRKKDLFDGYKNRSNWMGDKTYILNTEELATIFHFPITVAPISQPVESLDAKKIAPPSNLPIAEL